MAHKIKNNDRWKGLLVLLLLLFFLAKDKILSFISPCECEVPEALNPNFPPSPPDYVKGESLNTGGVESLDFDVEAYERGEDQSISKVSDEIFKRSFNPSEDTLTVKKYFV